LREEHVLKVSENRVLRRTLRPKRGEIMGGWRKLHNEELHNSSPDVITTINQRREGHVKMNAYRILVGKSEGKRALGRLKGRWVDNIKMNLRERGWGGMDWIDLAQHRDQWRALVNKVMNLRVP
jgi:hypothetical protein